HLEDPVMGPGAQTEGIEGRPEHVAGRRIQRTKAPDIRRTHPAVGPMTPPLKSLLLDPSGSVDPLPNRRRSLRRLRGGQGFEVDPRDFHMDIAPLQQRPRAPATVTVHLARRAAAGLILLPAENTAAAGNRGD